MLGSRAFSADTAWNGLGRGIKGGAAIAVLRDAWQQGHYSVELRRDGRRVIFFCTLCSTRCYSDAALSDHLNGNQHVRRAAFEATASTVSDSPFFATVESSSASDPRNGSAFEKCSAMDASPNHQIVSLPVSAALQPYMLGQFPPSSLKWLGYGQLVLREASCGPTPQAREAWCHWVVRKAKEDVPFHACQSGEGFAYAVVIFPYSDTIGRSGDWKPVFCVQSNSTQSEEKPSLLGDRKRLRFPLRRGTQLSYKDPELTANGNQTRRTIGGSKNAKSNGDFTHNEACRAKISVSKNVSNRALRRALKKQRIKTLERICFICHQQMLPGKDVAALFNMKTRQMMCNSRNRRGAFHVFHISCLIHWVLLCEVKSWIAQSVGCRTDAQKLQNHLIEKWHSTGLKIIAGSNGPIFCPECQGTGVRFLGTELEHPRFRLSQVFEWILELIQARKAWADLPDQWRKDISGLLFFSDKECCGSIIHMGFLHFYASGSPNFLSSSAVIK
eukprot:c28501_g1_i1 orf=612-2114(-)